MRRTNPYYYRYLTPRPDLVTDQERAFGELLASGVLAREAAERIGLPAASADRLRSSLYRKLHLHSALQLAHYAIAHRWIRANGRPGPPPKSRP